MVELSFNNIQLGSMEESLNFKGCICVGNVLDVLLYFCVFLLSVFLVTILLTKICLCY